MFRIVDLNNNKKLILRTLLELKTVDRRDVCFKYIRAIVIDDVNDAIDNFVYDAHFNHAAILKNGLIDSIQLISGGDDLGVFVHYSCTLPWKDSCNVCRDAPKGGKYIRYGNHSTSFKVLGADVVNLKLIDKWSSTIMD